MLDFKKQDKELYQPKTTPSIVDVPEMRFIVVNGKGDPNAEAFQTATELLFGLSYGIKMSHKAIMEYVVPPLEGLWWTSGHDISDKSRFEWSIMLRQPDFVTAEVFAAAIAALARKKPHLDPSAARFATFTEGLCVQAMHHGAYDKEAETINTLEAYAKESGYVFDIADGSIKTLSRRHHEIYLSDPRKTAPEKLKTVIRYPIKENA